MNQAQPQVETPADTRRVPALIQRLAWWLVWPYWVGLGASTHWPNLAVVPEPPADPHPLHAIMKLDALIHMACFGGLMLLLLLSGLGAKGRPWTRRCLTAVIIAAVYAVVDETTQQWVEGRSTTWSDLLANLVGIMAVYVLALLPGRRVKWRRSRGMVVAIALLLPMVLIAMLFPFVIDWGKQVIMFFTGPVQFTPHPGDYIFHGVVALILSILVFVAWPMCTTRPRLHGAAALSVLLIAGPAIEVLQHFTGRGVQPEDVQAHTIGVLVAMIWWSLRLHRLPPARESAPST